MNELLQQWEQTDDRRAIFLGCYALMTRNMLAGLNTGQFHDPRWVRALLEHFAGYYFDALDASALHYYGYSERQPRPIWIATTRRKRPVTVNGVPYRFVTLETHKFFGYVTEQLLEKPVQVAEREKAIADCLDHPEYCGGVIEPAKALWLGSDEIDIERLIATTQRLGNRAAARRLVQEG